MSTRIKRSTAFLVDDSGRLVGYVDENGRERELNGAFITPGTTPTKSGYVLAQSGVPVSVTGTTNEATLATIVVPAGALGPNGAVRVNTAWSNTNNANTKTVNTKFGNVTVVSSALTTTGSYRDQRHIQNRNSLSSQVFMAGSFGGFGSSGFVIGTGAVDTSKAQSIVLSAQLANGADTVTLEGYSVEILNP